jgi:hypothetical protein
VTWLSWPGARADSGYQGIDYVELIAFPQGSAPAARLVVHLQQPAGGMFTESSFRMSGGARTNDLSWSVPQPKPAGLPAQAVAIDLGALGDASERTVTLLADPSGLPVHPFFASATFRFHLDRDRGDCRPLAEAPPPVRSPRPAIDLLTKDYSGFVRLLSDWVKVKNPHWADLSPASLERVLLELLAHHGDLLSYYQDRVANEAFVEDASQRHSLRQHALLLGTALFDGAAAESTVAFTSQAFDGFVPEGTEITTAADAGDARVVFHTIECARVLQEHSRLAIAAWPGASDAQVPEGASELLLWGHQDRLLAGQRLAFVQGRPGQAGCFTQIVAIRALRFLELPGWAERPSDPLQPASALTAVTIDPPLERAVSPWPAAGSGGAFALFGNLAQVRHGELRHLAFAAEGGLPLQAGAFRDPHGTVVLDDAGEGQPPRLLLRAYRLPDGPVLFRAAAQASGVVTSEPMVEVTIGGEPWQRVEHLHGSAPFDHHYVATADEDGSLWLHFGDDVRGRAVQLLSEEKWADPSAAAAAPKIKARFRVGDPIAGNCGAGVLKRFAPDASGAAAILAALPDLEVVNLVPGRGGRESKEAARLRLPASLRHGPPERAVTLDDYARAALTVEGVARATARALGGPFNAVLVLVDPRGQTTLDDDLAAAVHARIDALRMAGREHFVRAPRYVPIHLELAVCVEPGNAAHRVRDEVLAALLPGTASAPGFFHPDRMDLGAALELDEIIAEVQRLPGVRSVKALAFRRAGVPKSRDVLPRIPLALSEVVRLDGDPSSPENGRLEVVAMGLDENLDPNSFAVARSAAGLAR